MVIINELLDKNTLKINEDKLEGVIGGTGKINEVKVYFFEQESSIKGGAVGLKQCEYIIDIVRRALIDKSPVIGIFSSAGARINEGICALAGCGEMLKELSIASRDIPQISIIKGCCAGATAIAPLLSDFVFGLKYRGKLCITGPEIVERALGSKNTLNELGGMDLHTTKTGLVDFLCEDVEECAEKIKSLLKFLYSQDNSKSFYSNNYGEKRTVYLDDSYDIKQVIEDSVDNNSFIEYKQEYAKNVVVGFATVCKKKIGIVANQPNYMCGCLDNKASEKIVIFLELCNKYNIPVVSLIDTPGFLPGKIQEENGIVNKASQIFLAYSQCLSEKITVILKKAYGGAYIVMGSRHVGVEKVFALKEAEIGIMGANLAVGIYYKGEISEDKNGKLKSSIEQKEQEYFEKNIKIDKALREGYVEKIINYHDIRRIIYKNI